MANSRYRDLRMQLHARELRFFVLEALAPQEPILQRLNHLRETAEHIESAFHSQSAKLVCYQQAQRCIVSNTVLAHEGHRIDLGSSIVVGAKKSDMLDLGRHRSRGRGMFLTGHFTVPVSSRALIASCVIDVGVAAMQLTFAQYQDATNVLGHTRARF